MRDFLKNPVLYNTIIKAADVALFLSPPFISAFKKKYLNTFIKSLLIYYNFNY